MAQLLNRYLYSLFNAPNPLVMPERNAEMHGTLSEQTAKIKFSFKEFLFIYGLLF